MAELDLGKVVMDSYNDLDNKPKINEVELSGNKTLEDLGIQQLIDAVNVSRLSKDIFAPYFETLEDFVEATATDVSVPHFGRMRINTENWGFGTRQIRYLIAYMRAYTEGVLDVLGNGIFWDDTNTMWHVAIHGSIGNLHIQYYKIEPNQIPTNNLLATVAGTPLDAVQGKVLYDYINKTSEIRTAFGEMGAYENLVVRGSICCQFNASNKCDIHISCKVISNTVEETNLFSFLSGEKIRTLLGLNSFSNNAHASKVIVQNYSGTRNLSEFAGLGGLRAYTSLSTGDIQLGRIYTEEGQIGGWGANSELFKVNTIFEIDLFNCSYT